MDKKILTGTVLLFILLIGVMCLYVGNSMLGGYKISVNGEISENLVTGWDCTYIQHSISEDSLLGIGFWYYPWETKDVQILVTLRNRDTGEELTGESWIGSLLNIADSERFTVDVHFVPKGVYDGVIQIYEVDKGFLGVSEQSKELKCGTDFEVNV